MYDIEPDYKYYLTRARLLNSIRLSVENNICENYLVQENGRITLDFTNSDSVVCDEIVQYAIFW